MEQTNKLVKRQADFESKALGIRAWVNLTKDGSRYYLALVDKDGNKLFLNKVEASASPLFPITDAQEAKNRMEWDRRYLE